YLVAGPTVIVNKAMKPLNRLNAMDFGNKANDGGYLTLTINELSELNLKEEEKQRFIKRFYGSKEFINGETRYCIWIEDADYADAIKIKSLKNRFDKVKGSRLGSRDAYAQSLAKRPHQFKTPRITNNHVIVTPRVSSENRPYLPV